MHTNLSRSISPLNRARHSVRAEACPLLHEPQNRRCALRGTARHPVPGMTLIERERFSPEIRLMKKIYLPLVIAALAAAAGCQTSDYGTAGPGYETGSSMDMPVHDRDLHTPPHGAEQLNRIGTSPDRDSVTPNQDRDQGSSGAGIETGEKNESSNSIQPDSSVVAPDRNPDTELNTSDPSLSREEKAKSEASHPN
jgi:hypothetical protein